MDTSSLATYHGYKDIRCSPKTKQSTAHATITQTMILDFALTSGCGARSARRRWLCCDWRLHAVQYNLTRPFLERHSSTLGKACVGVGLAVFATNRLQIFGARTWAYIKERKAT